MLKGMKEKKSYVGEFEKLCEFDQVWENFVESVLLWVDDVAEMEALRVAFQLDAALLEDHVHSRDDVAEVVVAVAEERFHHDRVVSRVRSYCRVLERYRQVLYRWHVHWHRRRLGRPKQTKS